jgi:hypothetical protein
MAGSPDKQAVAINAKTTALMKPILASSRWAGSNSIVLDWPILPSTALFLTQFRLLR